MGQNDTPAKTLEEQFAEKIERGLMCGGTGQLSVGGRTALQRELRAHRKAVLEEAAGKLWHGPNAPGVPKRFNSDRTKDRLYAVAELRRLGVRGSNEELVRAAVREAADAATKAATKEVLDAACAAIRELAAALRREKQK